MSTGNILHTKGCHLILYMYAMWPGQVLAVGWCCHFKCVSELPSWNLVKCTHSKLFGYVPGVWQGKILLCTWSHQQQCVH